MEHRTIVINAEHRETRVALLDNDRLAEVHVEQKKAESAVGNVYLGQVINTVPAIQAAFVDLGLERHGFLHIGDLRLDGLDLEKNPKIGQVLTKGQKLMVQVQKDPIATKGFKLSMDISLPGRYSVLMPLAKNAGVSRSIQDPEERKRLRAIRREAGADEVGVIVRTVAEGKAKTDVARDLRYLMRLWKTIEETAENLDRPGVVYREPDLVEKTLRDAYKQDSTRIIVDDEPTYQRVIRFLSLYYPRHEFINEVILHSEPTPIFKKYGLEHEIEKAIRRRVELESGGFLLLEESETLTAIDVNSGKLTKTSGPEETAVRTNLEAAEEVARQLRLRDIGGMIIVDFIQMGTKKQRNRVYIALKKALAKDRSRTKISYFSDLELVQITRRRVRESLEKQMIEACPYCKGEGAIFSKETVANQVLRDVREVLYTHFPTVIKVWLNPDVYHVLMEDQRYLRDLGQKMATSIVLIQDPNRHVQDYSIRPEGIPVVLATSPEAKRLRQEFLNALQEQLPAGSASHEATGAALTEAMGDVRPDPGPPKVEPAPIIGYWGDKELEDEARAHEEALQELQDSAAAEAAQEPKPSSRREARSQEKDREEKKEPRGRKDDRKPEKQPRSRAGGESTSGNRKKAQPVEAPPAAREKAPTAPPPPEPPPQKAVEPDLLDALPPRLSFRAENRPKLRFSSRRDLNSGRDYGRQYELWAAAAPKPAVPVNEPEPSAPSAPEPPPVVPEATPAAREAPAKAKRKPPVRRRRSQKRAQSPDSAAGES